MIELLAPVGSREALVAAVESGADAVYMGGKAFGARHYAPNFTDDELAAAIRFAHLRGVRVYVTVNILVDNGEIPSLTDYLRHLYNIGTDAIIVQDVGVAAIAKQVREQVITAATLHPKVEMTTLAATSAAPAGPSSTVTIFSAMRVTPDISSTESV